ncbi:MAG TPA: sulfotransferase [Phycisphaerae bacterium]|nr:sulfotransferase [Phycisphaerae bacterium]
MDQGQVRLMDGRGQGLGPPKRRATEGVRAEAFQPFFIVGCQRSGTTALAVMFDRHSALAVPSETEFFRKFARSDRLRRLPMTHEQLLSRACDDFYIRLTGVRFEDAIERFRQYPATYSYLFRALLETHAAKEGKRRSGEKTCDHLYAVDEILREYSEAKVICIIRDGRDVVRSISAAWGLKRWNVLCRQWIAFARLAGKLQRRLPPDRFTLVRYTDLMREPEREMRRLCAFIGEQFEPAQIETGGGSTTVPTYELAWKGKAREGPDPTRVEAWRKCEDRELIARLNFYMGRTLREWGYPDTEVVGIPWTRRLLWWMQYVPCWRGVFPIALRVHRVIRSIRGPAQSPSTPNVSA